MHRYTKEQLEFLREHAVGRKSDELTDIFNSHFGLSVPRSSIRSAKKNHDIKCGVDCKFKKGFVPPNKGKKGINYPGMVATQFEKGNKPWNYRPVGSERVNVDGYIEIKVADPRTWKAKHVLVWEKVNGSIPKGHVIIFADGDKTNVSLDNLILIPRSLLLVANRRKLLQGNAQATKTGLLIARVISKCAEAQKKAR